MAKKPPPPAAPPVDPTQTHFVDEAPYDPRRAADERDGGVALPPAAKPWALFWRRFRRHRLAVASAWVLGFFYFLIVPFAEIIAPYAQETRNPDAIHAPPQALHLFHNGEYAGVFTYAMRARIDLENFERVYEEDLSRPTRVRVFCLGDPYEFWGLIEMRFHLFCPDEGGTLHLLGTDGLGRDMLSRIIYGTRVSLTIGLIGLAISFVLGVVLGGLAGYFGGLIDNVIERLIELIRSLPELPLWLALAAALPANWPPIFIYFGITLILGLLDWPGLARAVRARVLQLREEEFVLAATLTGASPQRLVRKHMLPNFSSHLIASATLSVPGMILGETALSFLGLGLRAPVVSWGVLLNDAQDLSAIEVYPWLLLPMVPVILVVLAFNFFGDGLRDAADPYR